MPIPVEVEDVTAEWLTEVLQSHAPGATVDAVEVLDRSSGTTGRARLGLVSTDERIPPSVFVKLPPFTAERRAMVTMVGMGIAEAQLLLRGRLHRCPCALPRSGTAITMPTAATSWSSRT